MTIKISGDEVRRHAAQVDAIADEIADSRSAAATIRSSGGAYGHFIGQLVAVLLNEQADHVIRTYGTSVEAVHGLADGLRGMADDFDRSDERSADRVEKTR